MALQVCQHSTDKKNEVSIFVPIYVFDGPSLDPLLQGKMVLHFFVTKENGDTPP